MFSRCVSRPLAFFLARGAPDAVYRGMVRLLHFKRTTQATKGYFVEVDGAHLVLRASRDFFWRGASLTPSTGARYVFYIFNAWPEQRRDISSKSICYVGRRGVACSRGALVRRPFFAALRLRIAPVPRSDAPVALADTQEFWDHGWR